MEYADFVEAKTQLGGEYGFEPTAIPDACYDFQSHLIEWSTRPMPVMAQQKTGLGKAGAASTRTDDPRDFGRKPAEQLKLGEDAA